VNAATARAVLFAVALGVVLRWPALDGGFREDDFVQRATLEGAFPIARGPLDLFWFSGATDAESRALQDAGYLPWWRAPELRLAMLRPLSSALVWLDYAAFGADAWWQHAHSLAWWALLIASAGLLLGRLFSPAIAGVAVVLYALDETHAIPVAWLANRSTLLATAFGFLAIVSHVRWREDAWRPGAWWSALAATFALGAGEYALGVLAFVLAYELCAGRGDARARARALLPVGIPCAAYLATRATLGYGVRDSGFYVDPLDLTEFAPVAARRIPAFVADLVLGVPSQWANGGSPWRRHVLALGWFDPATWRSLPDWRLWHTALGAIALAVTAWLGAWARRTVPEAWRQVRWMLLGALFSLVPAASSLPGPRVLAAAGIVAAALFAVVIDHAWRLGRDRPAPGRALAALAACALAVHGLLAAERAFGHATRFGPTSRAAIRYALDAEIPRDGRARTLDAFVVAASDFTTAAHVPWVRWAHGLVRPRAVHRLSGAMLPHDLTRVSPNAFDLEVLAEDVRETAAGSLYRPTSAWIVEGSHFALPGVRINVLEARHGNPARVRYTFDTPLDAGGRAFLVARPDGLRRLELPPVGSTVRLPAAAVPPAVE
jgi:hypothetical protein